MQLKVLLPTQVIVDQPVVKINAQSERGSFVLLPRHIDFLSSLAPGLLSYTTESEDEQFLAVDGGLLVKVGQQVLISTGRAVVGGDLGHLREVVEQEFSKLDERRQASRSAMARLEATFLRRFLDMEESRL